MFLVLILFFDIYTYHDRYLAAELDFRNAVIIMFFVLGFNKFFYTVLNLHKSRNKSELIEYSISRTYWNCVILFRLL